MLGFKFGALLATLATAVNAGTVVWDGRFNDLTSSTDLEKWSWGNQVGPYQYYIHGSGPVTKYVNLSPSYKNPADGLSKQGVKITIDPTALWNSDMWRTELIPQTKANLGTGTLWYHFSMKKTATNSPNPNYEHQVNFFESHFTEMKYGWINGEPTGVANNNLQWFVGGQSKWKVDWVNDVWHNFAYEINFSSNSVVLWHSTGGNALVKTAGPFSASTSTNSADWHLGVLRLPNRQGGTNAQGAEDWYFSGVYVESGSLTTAFTDGTTPGEPVSTPVTSPTSTPVVTPIVTPTPTPTPTPSPTTPPVQKWGQCGGIGWSGSTNCVEGSKCNVISDYYHQCL